MQVIKFWLTMLLLNCSLSGWLAADQNDARLDPLFEQLQTATDNGQLEQLEDRIWRVWMNNTNAEIDELMAHGITAMNRGEYEVALTHFDRMVAMAPAFAEGWNKRATVHYLLGNLTESMTDIQRTLQLEPRHFGALSGMGLIFIKIGDETGALQAYREVLKIHPHSASAQQQVESLQQKLRDQMI